MEVAPRRNEAGAHRMETASRDQSPFSHDQKLWRQVTKRSQPNVIDMIASATSIRYRSPVAESLSRCTTLQPTSRRCRSASTTAPEWQTAIQALMLVAEHDGPTM